MIKLKLIKLKETHSFLSCIDEIESSLVKRKDIRLKTVYSKTNYFKRVLLKILQAAYPFNFPKVSSGISLSIAMGPYFPYLIPDIFKTKHNYIYLYDGWPRFHNYILKTCKALGVKAIFFSSKKASEAFCKLNSNIKGYWIPEAINVDDYRHLDYKNKLIDVLEFGRKYENYHEKIVDALNKYDKIHLYEKVKGDIIFKTRKDFINGLASSKISICIPSNITHPDRAENISSMTLRYLQSMASKCLIVGIMPEEMHVLFDYMPIIEIDFINPKIQILDILKNYESYHPLIEKNYKEVLKNHTWDYRLNDVIKVIKNEQSN